MEHSSSEPVLRHEDYYVACHGVGDTGPANRVTHGAFFKDTGIFSSRINVIVRQAEKVPGPGKYVAHEDWALGRSSAFAKGARTYKPMNKTPPPGHYERKDFMEMCANSCKDVLSQNPRVIHGRIPKGKRRSFLDYAERHGKEVPGPVYFESNSKPRPKASNRLDGALVGALDWDRETKQSESKKQPETSIGPDHYKGISWSQMEESEPKYSVPKEKAQNFLDKAVKEKMFWDKPKDGNARVKREMPGPGTYDKDNNFDLSKTSRGTFHLQLRGLSRSSASGYF